MKKKLLLFFLLSLSMVSYSATTATGQSAASSAALNEYVGSETSSTDPEMPLFYIVEDSNDFTQVATLPGFSMGAPSGLVPGWGVVFGGVSGSKASGGDSDGAGGFGMGWGDPYEYVGGTVGIGLGSIDVRDDDDKGFSRGTGSFSIGRVIREYKLGVAAGISTIDLWHNDSSDQPKNSYYFAATKIMPNDIAPIIATAGVGSDSYAGVYHNDQNHKWKEFFSLGAYIHPQMSLIADYTSGMSTLGVGLVPMPKYPVTVTLGAVDIFKQDKDTDAITYAASLSAAYIF